MRLFLGFLSPSRRIVGLPLLTIRVDALTQPVQRQRRLLRLALPTERIKALARSIEFVRALGELLPVRGELALQRIILSLQIGDLAPKISGLMLQRVAHGRLLAGVWGWLPLGLALCDSRPAVRHQALQFIILALQIGDLALERVTRSLPLLLLCDIRDRRTLLLKLQLLLELRDQTLKFVVQFTVLTLQIVRLRRVGRSPLSVIARGRALRLALRELLADLCHQILEVTDLVPQIGSPIVGYR